jgi:hypothetical protein
MLVFLFLTSFPPSIREGLRLDVRIMLLLCHARLALALREGLRLDVRLVSVCYHIRFCSQNKSAGVIRGKIQEVIYVLFTKYWWSQMCRGWDGRNVWNAQGDDNFKQQLSLETRNKDLCFCGWVILIRKFKNNVWQCWLVENLKCYGNPAVIKCGKYFGNHNIYYYWRTLLQVSVKKDVLVTVMVYELLLKLWIFVGERKKAVKL